MSKMKPSKVFVFSQFKIDNSQLLLPSPCIHFATNAIWEWQCSANDLIHTVLTRIRRGNKIDLIEKIEELFRETSRPFSWEFGHRNYERSNLIWTRNRFPNLILENVSSDDQFSTQDRRRILVKFRSNCFPDVKIESKSSIGNEKLPEEIFTIDRREKGSIKNVSCIIDSKSTSNSS